MSVSKLNWLGGQIKIKTMVLNWSGILAFIIQLSVQYVFCVEWSKNHHVDYASQGVGSAFVMPHCSASTSSLVLFLQR